MINSVDTNFQPEIAPVDVAMDMERPHMHLEDCHIETTPSPPVVNEIASETSIKSEKEHGH
jgi:hypothetical protein